MSGPSLLLVSPPDYQTREFRGAQPLGIAYLAAVLRESAGRECALLDANVGGSMPLPQVVQRADHFISSAKLRGHRPVVGLSVVTQVLATSVELAQKIKASHPDTLIIMGGYHPTFAHQQVLEDFDAVDLCVRGEGEQTLVEIMERWEQSLGSPAAREVCWDGIKGVTWRHGDGIVVNPRRANSQNLDALPFPARDLLPALGAYPVYPDAVSGKLRLKASIMSSRGCPFHCSFCSIVSFYGDAGGRPWRGRSAPHVVAEMTELAERYGASHFEFQDDNFFVKPRRALEIIESFARTGHDFSFAFLTRADQVVRGKDFFPALRRAGLRYVSVGIESGSDASLKRMVKGTTVETNRRALQILHDNDVAAQVEFIMFEPDSTVADLRANLRFLEEQGLLGYFPPLIFGRLLLLPGTPVRKHMEQRLGISGDIHLPLSYQFRDPGVTEISGMLSAFQHKLGDAWYKLAFRLLDGIPAAEIALRESAGTDDQGMVDSRALAALKLEFFALTRIPYGLLSRALQALESGIPIPVESLLEQAATELRTVSAQVERLEQIQPLPAATPAALGITGPAGY